VLPRSSTFLFATNSLLVFPLTSLLVVVRTQGHTHGATGGAWHPRERERVLTSGRDGSLRLWELGSAELLDFTGKQQCAAVLKPRASRGTKIVPTCCAWHPGGGSVWCADEQGGLHMWPVPPNAGALGKSAPSRFGNASSVVRGAHGGGGGATCLVFAADGHTFGTRGLSDGLLKLWDVRRLATPVKVLGEEGEAGPGQQQQQQQQRRRRRLEAAGECANLAFSADGSLVACGTGVHPSGEEVGRLDIFDVHSASVDPVHSMGLGGGGSGKGQAGVSAVCVAWPARSNQLAVGLSSGATHVLYDPACSVKGALMAAGRKRKAKAINFGALAGGAGGGGGVVHTPHALPMFKQDTYGKLAAEKARRDPVASRRPELPSGGSKPGIPGAYKSSFTQHFMQNRVGGTGPTLREQDPREVLLAHDEAAEKEGVWMARAYAQNAPKPVLHSQTAEQELADKAEAQKKMARH
jgi:WD repeat-containing protein 70